MKHFISVLLLLAFATQMWGQDCSQLQFKYDDAGNRTRRTNFSISCFTGNGDEVMALAIKPANTPATITKSPLTTLTAFPNPNKGVFQVQIDNPQENGVLDLYDFVGRKVYSQEATSTNVPMNVPYLVLGTYLLVYRTPEKIVSKLKFVID